LLFWFLVALSCLAHHPTPRAYANKCYFSICPMRNEKPVAKK
jgi:hypothetical protein